MSAILTDRTATATEDRGTGRIFYRLHLTRLEAVVGHCPETGITDHWGEWRHDVGIIEVPDLGPYGAYNAVIDAIAAERFPGWHVAEATLTLTPPLTAEQYAVIPF